ncbi:hypothetical protein niasHT_013494 [Heterodera trifolii]|uniref:Uncharacterized protein n=1 Tax=Heterodera trifolii TaxID=157864 RepID=A0ABD2LD14_9BILA
MVSKRRYNSVERFTSLHLSEFDQRQQLRPMDHSPIGISEPPPTRADFPMPTSMAPPSPSQQQQMAHPFSLMRRRSHEQLQIPNASAQALLRVPPVYSQQKGSAILSSFASSSVPYAQQQQQRQYPQNSVQSSPHSHSLSAAYAHPQPLFVPSSTSSPPFQPLQIRPQQSPAAIHSIRHSSVPRGDDFDRANASSKNKIPPAVWAVFSVLEVLFGIVSLFVGALNANPYNCLIQPNVPIYLILSGILLILNGAARVFLSLSASPAESAKRRDTRQMRRSNGRRPALTYAVEGIGLLAILVVLILGSVWVYGASRYMHSQLYMFERHFCEHTLYWFAWWSVTIHLALFALLILLGIVVLIFGAIPGRK